MATTDTNVIATVKADVAWAQHHLFLLLAVGVLTLAGVYGVESLLSKRAHENFLQEQAILQQFTQQNQQIQQQTKTQIDTLTQSNVVLQQQLTSLTAAIASRDAQLIKDRQEVKTLPPTQLATKWGAEANEPAPAIDANGNFVAPLPLAQKSVDAFIQIPVLQQDNKDLQSQLSAEKNVATNNDQKFQAEAKAHQSDNEACKQTIVTKDAEIKDIKAQNRKRNIIIAIVGFALGIATKI